MKIGASIASLVDHEAGASNSRPSRHIPCTLADAPAPTTDKDVMHATFDYASEATAKKQPPGGHMATRMVIQGLLPVSIGLWALGVAETNTGTLGLYGLPAKLPVIFYLGIVLLIISAGIELARAELSKLRLALHSGTLTIILYGTPALVYSEGRYAWLYKTVGVVQYIKVNGHLTGNIDIYQYWPGFFALAAWFDRVAGVSTPLDYAKWSQLVFELAALPLLYSIYSSLSLPTRHRWLGLMLYSAGNWIAQDYFSPQALSTLLSLGIMAIVLRWMVAGNTPGHLTRDDEELASCGDRPREGTNELRRRGAIPFMAALLILFFVVVFSHELSPYIITIQLIALAVVGQVRPRWIPLAGLAITVGYLLPNFSYVNSHYGLLSSFGDFFSNIQSPSASDPGTTPESQRVIADCADLLSVGMWLLALTGAWLRRKSRRTVIGLLFLTFSPVFVLVGGAYGNEGILRVYLFSLPWAAALATFALIPVRTLSRRNARHATASAVSGPARTGLLHTVGRDALRGPAALACAVALFFPAFYGNDSTNVMPESQVTATSKFLESATPGLIMLPIDNTSISDTAKYNQFPSGQIFGDYGLLETSPQNTNIASYLARTAVNYTDGTLPAYILITPSMMSANAAYGYVSLPDMNMLLSSLQTSRYWQRIVSTDGTMVYEITPTADDIPSGPYNSSPIFSVP
jgi:hypothetical protein